MKIELTTVYENVDDDFLKYYIEQIMPVVPINYYAFKQGVLCIFKSRDPDTKSKVTVTTTYKLTKDKLNE